MAVIDTDRGWGNLKKDLLSLMGKDIRVGVQADATDESGGQLARIAAINEFGGTINMPAREQTVYRQANKAKTGFNRKGRFVRKEKSNFSTTHHVDAYTVNIPARPFLRSAFDENVEEIDKFAKGKVMEVARRETSPEAALSKIGQEMQKIVQKKIRTGPFAPNAPSTKRKKKSSKPLIDKGNLRQSIRYEIKNKE